ncbi:MAG: hypothetical protein KDC98_05245 [Planctomycetes bacterium]|nr:hypothetical protein [Planctomycetota bacterium]
MTALLSTLLSLALLPQAPSTTPVPARPLPVAWNAPFSGLWIDPVPDVAGRHWCRGTRYKMSFGADGASYVPLLGHTASRSYPIAFRLEGAASAVPERQGTRFAFDRGEVVERWDLFADGAEQSFVLDAPPRGNELVITIETDLRFAGAGPDGLCFRGEGKGRVLYGHAVGIDARGYRTPLKTTFEGGRIHLALPTVAAYPLVVDPLVSTVDVALQEVADNLEPDVALHAGTGRWAVVMTERLSALDSDLKLRRFDLAGNAVDTDFLEVSSQIASEPAIACSQGGAKFMAVWRQAGLDIIARGVTANGALPDAPVTVGNGVVALGTFCLRPDIGGSEGSGFLTTYTFEGTSIPPSITCRTLSDTAVVGTGINILTGTGCLSSAVSDRRLPSNDWLVAFCRQSASCAFGGDIGYAAVDVNGTLANATTTVAGGVLDDDRHVDVAWNGSRGLIVWDRDMGSHHDVMLRIVRKTGAGYQFVGAEHDLSVEEPGGIPANDQQEPIVACDGVRFLCCYKEGSNGLVVGTGVGVAGAGLLFHEGHEFLINNALPHDVIGVAGGAPGPDSDTRWLVVADERLGLNDHDVRGVFYDGLVAANMFTTVGTGCTPISGTRPLIAVTGSSAVGDTFTVATSNTTALPFLIAGLPQTPTTFCQYLVTRRCQQGVALPALAVVFGGALSVTVPADTGLVGVRFAFQGIDLLAAGACNASLFGAAFAVTDTIVATVR